MKETKQLTQVNDGMVKKTLLKAGKVVAGLGLMAALASGCSQPTGGGGLLDTWRVMPWEGDDWFKAGSHCGPLNPDPFLCYNTVASQAGLGGLEYCTGTQECREATENVFLNALYHQWNVVRGGQGLVHDLNVTGHKGDPVLQRYMSYGYNGFPCTTAAEVNFARQAANAWTCGDDEWNFGILGSY